MSVLRVCPGIRPRTWAVIILWCLGVWTVAAGLVWLLVGWLAS